MDLTLSSEQELIAETAREFLESRCPASHVREMGADELGWSPELWSDMADLGWMGLALPESVGGADGEFLDLCLIIEQMGRTLLPSPFVATIVLGALPIAAFGTPDQVDLLKGVAAGETILSLGWSGPSGRWSRDDLGVTATKEGDGFVLEGEAWFVPFGGAADRLLIAADNDDGITLFIVAGEGLTAERLHTTGHVRTDRVGFDKVLVDGSSVLGEVGDGAAVLEWTLDRATAATAVEMVGGAQKVLDMTVEYAGQREQFGTPIGSFQAVQHRCADMAMDVLGARFMAYEAAWRLANDEPELADVSVAKAWVSDAYRRVAASGHQVHGAIGFTDEHDLHLYLDHATDTELTLGDTPHHLGRVATALGL